MNRTNASPDVGVGSEESLDLPDDSSDTVESSSSELRTSKKRKLDGTDVTAPEEVVSAAVGAFRILYLAICGTIRQLQALTTDLEKIRGYAVEHMKSSLKCSSDDAAHILGSSFYLTNRIIQTPQRHWHQKRIFTKKLLRLFADTGYRSCVDPVVDIWNRRSLIGQQPSNFSNVCKFNRFWRSFC